MTRTAITGAALFGLVVTSLSAPLLMTGCKQEVLCPALDSCGGAVPSGDYVLDLSHPSCSEDLWIAPADPRLTQADLPTARQVPPDPALFDWCQLLVTGLGTDIVARRPPFYYAQDAPIGSATLHYDATTNLYALSTTRTGTYTLDFPSYCMRAFGGVGSGADLCQRLQVSLQKTSPAKYSGLSCVADPNDDPATSGCLCQFNLDEVQTSTGRFLVRNDATILHLPGNNFPETATYCNQGDTLQLTGANGEYLFDRVGLRTMSMVKTTVNCTDGIHGPGEDGVDCGPACPMLCP